MNRIMTISVLLIALAAPKHGRGTTRANLGVEHLLFPANGLPAFSVIWHLLVTHPARRMVSWVGRPAGPSVHFRRRRACRSQAKYRRNCKNAHTPICSTSVATYIAPSYIIPMVQFLLCSKVALQSRAERRKCDITARGHVR